MIRRSQGLGCDMSHIRFCRIRLSTVLESSFTTGPAECDRLRFEVLVTILTSDRILPVPK
jgi:hypothetical protein